MNSSEEELLSLLSSHMERRLNDEESNRVTELLRSHPELLKLYVEYMGLHGLLVWDIASIDNTAPNAPSSRQSINFNDNGLQRCRRSRKHMRMAALLASIVVIIAIPMAWRQRDDSGNAAPVAPQNVKNDARPQDAIGQNLTSIDNTDDTDSLPSAKLPPLAVSPARKLSDSKAAIAAVAGDSDPDWQHSLRPGFTDNTVVATIDSFINAALHENEVTASPRASDSEWVRRAYLTIAGRIPDLTETQHFLTSTDRNKRNRLLDKLLQLPERSGNLASIWTNLLVGRVSRREIDRERLFQFLYTTFEENQSWMNTVGQLLTAQGRNDENGAANFLLAHLNDQATPATAVTSRLFLGQQLNCVQCHDHPFSQQMYQRDYWAFNAFFRDTVREIEAGVSNAGDMLQAVWKLTDQPGAERMTFFENRRGQQIATPPCFDGRSISADSTQNRREILARMLATDSRSRVARAMVNRMWARFFGFGFTPSVDDMGSHAVVSHPELLDFLTAAFVASDYDLRRLTKWIAATDAWNRTSEVAVATTIDRPEAGEVPLFSRVYVRRMSPEQVYESVRVAVRSAAGISVSPNESSDVHRHQWVQQFASAYDTDENDECLDFGGSISQALVMMNGEDVDQAIRQAAEAVAVNEGHRMSRNTDALNRLSLAILTRKPTASEEQAFRRHVRHTASRSPAGRMAYAVEDMMWAYLNSSEFILVH